MKKLDSMHYLKGKYVFVDKVFTFVCAVPPMMGWAVGTGHSKWNMLVQPSSVRPVSPMVQWDGVDSRYRALQMGHFGTILVRPVPPMVQWDGMDSRYQA